MRSVAHACDEDVELDTAVRTVDCGEAQTRELVMAVVSEHAQSLLRTARRHSLCAEDAQDAYQRAMEVFVRRAATLDPALAHKWLHTVWYEPKDTHTRWR